MSSGDAEIEAQLLGQLNGAFDREAAQKLLQLLQRDLRRIAHERLRGLPGSCLLRTTALVNEAYLKLFSPEDGVGCTDREHFLGRAAHAMRSILVDHVRSENRERRRAQGQEVPLNELTLLFEERFGDLAELDDAMNKLGRVAPRAAQIVELRFFGDCSVHETAEILGVSRRSVERDWRTARAFLQKELR